MNNDVMYQGIVSVNKYKRSKLIFTNVLHNVGTWNLFNSICELLFGNTNSSLLPTYLDVCYIDNGKFMSILSSTAVIRTQSISPSPVNPNATNIPCSITFTATLASGNILVDKPSVGTNNQVYFVLRGGNNNILAYVNNSEATVDSFTIAQDEVYIVNWTLNFSNTAI